MIIDLLFVPMKIWYPDYPWPSWEEWIYEPRKNPIVIGDLAVRLFRGIVDEIARTSPVASYASIDDESVADAICNGLRSAHADYMNELRSIIRELSGAAEALDFDLVVNTRRDRGRQ